MASHNSYFSQTGFSIDVFHFKKHKVSDDFCQLHCNPADFTEMIDHRKWQFNTSICEQLNIWLAGFHSILQDMEATRYNFYLNEMIKRKNMYTVSKLKEKGFVPIALSVDELFSE